MTFEARFSRKIKGIQEFVDMRVPYHLFSPRPGGGGGGQPRPGSGASTNPIPLIGARHGPWPMAHGPSARSHRDAFENSTRGCFISVLHMDLS